MHIRGPVELQTIEHRILRRIALLGICLGFIGTVRTVWWAWQIRPWNSFIWFPWGSGIAGIVELLSETASHGSEILLLVSAVAIHRWRRWGYLGLMIWAPIAASAGMLVHAAHAVNFGYWRNGDLVRMSAYLTWGAVEAAFPLLVFLILRRPELRAIFAVSNTRGFEILSAQAPDGPSATAPAMPVEPVTAIDPVNGVVRSVALTGLTLAAMFLPSDVLMSIEFGWPGGRILTGWLGPAALPLDYVIRTGSLVLLAGSLLVLLGRGVGRYGILWWSVWSLASYVLYGLMSVTSHASLAATQPALGSTLRYAWSITLLYCQWIPFPVAAIWMMVGLGARPGRSIGESAESA